MSYFWTLSAWLPLVFAAQADAQLPRGEKAGERIEWNTLDELAGRIASDAHLPGVALAWGRLGEEPQVGAVGGEEPIRPGDRFHIGSITKSIRATALAALVDRGRLHWDDRLADLLPGTKMNEAYADVTLRRVLRHRAGIVEHLTMDDAEMVRLNALRVPRCRAPCAAAAEKGAGRHLARAPNARGRKPARSQSPFFNGRMRDV